MEALRRLADRACAAARSEAGWLADELPSELTPAECGHPGARPAAQAPGPPVPARRLARHPLAAGLGKSLLAFAGVARGGAGSARTRGRSRRRSPRGGRWRPSPLPGCGRNRPRRSPAGRARPRRAARRGPPPPSRPAAAARRGCPRRCAAARASPSGRRARHVVRDRRPQRDHRDVRRVQGVLQHPDDPGRALVVGGRRRRRAESLVGPADWTGTGRVCGESASSAPISTTSSTPSSARPVVSSLVKPPQRMFGSTPWTRTTSRDKPVGIVAGERQTGWSARPGARRAR